MYWGKGGRGRGGEDEKRGGGEAPEGGKKGGKRRKECGRSCWFFSGRGKDQGIRPDESEGRKEEGNRIAIFNTLIVLTYARAACS